MLCCVLVVFLHIHKMTYCNCTVTLSMDHLVTHVCVLDTSYIIRLWYSSVVSGQGGASFYLLYTQIILSF